MMELRHATHLEGWFNSEWGHLPLRQAHWHTLILRAPAVGPRPAGGSDATVFGKMERDLCMLRRLVVGGSISV
jgi:hypothetical protein